MEWWPIAVIGTLQAVAFLGGWVLHARRSRCFHHDHKTGATWIKQQLINMGSGKMWWCGRCGRTLHVF